METTSTTGTNSYGPGLSIGRQNGGTSVLHDVARCTATLDAA